MALGFYTPTNQQEVNVMPIKEACQKLKDKSQYVGGNAFYHLLKVTDYLSNINQANNGVF
jgi:hypothetical protein